MQPYLEFHVDSKSLTPDSACEWDSPAPSEAAKSNQIGARYVIRDPSLVAAINAALMLNKPLLLTGQPGTGKTRLANRIAWFLGLGAPLRFETKSTSVARDLFYSYDALGRFHSAAPEPGESAGQSRLRSTLDFITFNALGQAILRTRGLPELPAVLQSIEGAAHPNVCRALRAGHSGNGHLLHRPHRSVVLIDEMDKASRDFPNDLLNEIDRLYFRITELRSDEEVQASSDERLWPIIVITSNSEKNLPDAFLRRCIYHHIEFPDTFALRAILTAHLPDIRGSALLKGAIDFFEMFRRQSLQKEYSTAELIDWVKLLVLQGADAHRPLREQGDFFERTKASLAKTKDDQKQLLDTWTEYRGKSATEADVSDGRFTSP